NCQLFSVHVTSRNSNRKSPKSQTKIPKKWRENLFVPARDFFNSRTKTKIFSDHVFQNRNTPNFSDRKGKTESLGEMKSRALGGCKPAQDEHKTNTPREKR
ncbi:DUF1661 domain-containing protein, partial [Porphyromonas gingivalis]